MFPHHKIAIERLIDYFKEDMGVVAIILGGSVAKGLERADSDIDAMVIVTQEKHGELAKYNRLTECIFGYCNYEGGYFDIKYYLKEYLVTAACCGSEPARNAFLHSRCIFSRDSEVADIVSRIPIFQKEEKDDKLLSFYSAFSLNIGYFWDCSIDNPYLKIRAAADIVLFGYRMLLEENEILFPCHKSLEHAVALLDNKPVDIIQKCHNFLEKLDDVSKETFVNAILEFLSYKPPADYSAVLTRYTADNELWWYNVRPVIAEW